MTHEPLAWRARVKKSDGTLAPGPWRVSTYFLGLDPEVFEVEALGSQEQLEQALRVCAEAYQVLGAIFYKYGIPVTGAAAEILDNLAEARVVHEDVLPWAAPTDAKAPTSLEALPLPELVVTDTGHAWLLQTNPTAKGVCYYSEEQVLAITAKCVAVAEAMAADFDSVEKDHQHLVRELDVLLNGEADAAKQASLCDIVSQVREQGIALAKQSPTPQAAQSDAVAFALLKNSKPALQDKSMCLSFSENGFDDYFAHNNSPADAIFGPRVVPLYATPQQSEQGRVEVSDVMVDAYLKEQRRTVEEADMNFGRPNVGGLHTSTVREACRNGIRAALTTSGEAVQGGDTARLDWLLPNLHPVTYGLDYDSERLDADWNKEFRRAIDLELAASQPSQPGSGGGV